MFNVNPVLYYLTTKQGKSNERAVYIIKLYDALPWKIKQHDSLAECNSIELYLVLS